MSTYCKQVARVTELEDRLAMLEKYFNIECKLVSIETPKTERKYVHKSL